MIKESVQTIIEKGLAVLPVMQYAWLESCEIPFSERVRDICREECPRYGTSWACPPGTGTIEQCRETCKKYEGVLVFTTIAEVQDVEDMQETLGTRRSHENITEQIRRLFRTCGMETLALSGYSCARCRKCTYPDAPCRHPDSMLPCIEGYGIVVPLLAEKADLVFDNGRNTVTWFGAILFTNLP